MILTLGGYPWGFIIYWLVVSTPLKHISQLGWLLPIYGQIKKFQTTNQYTGWMIPESLTDLQFNKHRWNMMKHGWMIEVDCLRHISPATKTTKKLIACWAIINQIEPLWIWSWRNITLVSQIEYLYLGGSWDELIAWFSGITMRSMWTGGSMASNCA